MDHTEQYLEQHADANGNVSDENILRLLTGGAGEGDTAGEKPAESGAPAAGDDATKTDKPAGDATASQSAPEADKPAGKAADTPADKQKDTTDPVPTSEADAVILAKDGKHTIPYQRLADAREEARAAKARADAAEAQLAERAKAPAVASTAAPAPADAPAQADDVFGDYSDAAIKRGVDSLVAQAVSKVRTELTAELEPVKRQAAETAAEAHARAIYTKHPDTDSIVESAEYQQWLAAQPSFVRQAYENVAAKGSAAQVIEMLDVYKAARPRVAAPAPAPAPAPATAPAASAQKKAEEIVAATKPKTPISLSDIPAGSPVATDESEAIAEMDAVDLMNKLLGKSPAEIERMVTRLV